MARMQVLGLGLVLVLSWAASSSGLDVKKIPGRWFHSFTASNKMELLIDYDYMRLYLPYFECIDNNCDAILLKVVYRYLGRYRHLSTVIEKQHQGLYHTEANTLQILDVGDSMLLLGYTYQGYRGRTSAILALGRRRTLSEADIEKFQKLLQQRGIVAEPMSFTGDDNY